MSRHQIHGDRDFDRMPGQFTARHSLSMQFHAPVRYENIRGTYQWSFQLEAPAIVWGKDGRFWAFFHDFDSRSVRLILDDCRQATFDRRGSLSNPFESR
jgi:hypothetical protein